MEDFIFAPIVLIIGLGIHAAVLRNHHPTDARLLTLSFGAHVASAIIQVLLVLYYFPGGGDMLGYFATGVPMAEVLRADFVRYAPEVFKAFLQFDEFFLPVNVFGGASTQSMSAASGFIMFVCGNSLYAATIAIGIATYLSKVTIAYALRDYFPAHQQRLVLVGATLLPTAVFWSSALLKEPLIMVAIGPALLALKWLSVAKRRLFALALLIPSAVTIAMLKPYVLMTLGLSAAVFYLWTRFAAAQSAALKPFAIVTALAIGGGGLVLGSRYFAKGEADSAASVLASQRMAGYGVQGGSNFRLEDAAGGETDLAKRSLASELALAPFALLTAFFRPLIFEARNAVQFANALEATFLLYLFFQVLRNRGWRPSLTAIRRSPAMMFCFVFSVALALGTGLASTNMGTLSRYRAPMMPFFFILLLVLRRAPQAEATEELAALTPAAAAR